MEKKANIIRRVQNYLRDISGELKKVTWPSRNDLQKTTIAVFISSIFFGIYLFVVDFVFSTLINEVIRLLK